MVRAPNVTVPSYLLHFPERNSAIYQLRLSDK